MSEGFSEEDFAAFVEAGGAPDEGGTVSASTGEAEGAGTSEAPSEDAVGGESGVSQEAEAPSGGAPSESDAGVEGDAAQSVVDWETDDNPYKDRYRHLQALKDRQLADEYAKREALEAMLAEQEAAQQPEGPVYEPATSEVVQQYVDHAAQSSYAARDAFTHAIQNQPDAVPHIIQSVADGGNMALASELMMGFQTAMAQAQAAQVQEHLASFQQPQAEAGPDPRVTLTNAAKSVREADPEAYDAAKADVAAELKRLATADPESDAQAKRYRSIIESGDEAMLGLYLDNLVKGSLYRQSIAAAQQAPAHTGTPAPSFVETGTPGGKPADPSFEESIQKGVLNASMF